VPVLYLVFNRPEIVKETFEQIRKAKPCKLFIGADGPRTEEEKNKTEKVREYILKNIDWECEVKTLFRDKNLGCSKAISEAITWFFKEVEYGIIIEDDCLVSQSFFTFCKELLEKYRRDPNIFSISSMKAYGVGCKDSYDFTKILRVWGWATWAEVWERTYDREINIMNESNTDSYMKKVFRNPIERLIFKKRYKGYIKDNSTTWEFPIIFGMARAGKLNISPSVNMVKNIGIKNQSINDRYNKVDESVLSNELKEISFPLKHPRKVKLNKNMCNKILIRDIKRLIKKNILKENFVR